MKKTFLEPLNVPLSPLLPPFHISREKKTLTFTPFPLNSKKKKERKKSTCTLSPLAQ
jgi:hypothetical protein